MRQSFSISFICRTSKANAQGYASVECSISINCTRVVFTLPRKEKPNIFKKAMASSRNSDIKRFCQTVHAKVNECVTNLMTKGIEVTAQNVKSEYFAQDVRYTLNDCFADFMAFQRKRTASESTLTTYSKYRLAKEWYTSHFDCSIAIEDFKVGDIYTLKAELTKEFKPQTVNSYLSRLRSVFIWASNNGKCTINPFSQFKIAKPKVEITYLSKKELSAIERKVFSCDRLNNVRDIFLFQCYTALSYGDMASLVESDILVNAQGQRYIQKQRHKTGVTFTVPLMPKALAILEKYNYKLPVLSNQNYNAYLKEIADLCGIKQNVHSHLARHTFATIALNAGMPISVVSKVLGHSNTNITQAHYARLLDSTVIESVNAISDKF